MQHWIGHSKLSSGVGGGKAARYLQEPGREWGGRLEQSLRVVAAEQLDLPIPESKCVSALSELGRTGKQKGKLKGTRR